MACECQRTSRGGFRGRGAAGKSADPNDLRHRCTDIVIVCTILVPNMAAGRLSITMAGAGTAFVVA